MHGLNTVQSSREVLILDGFHRLQSCVKYENLDYIINQVFGVGILLGEVLHTGYLFKVDPEILGSRVTLLPLLALYAQIKVQIRAQVSDDSVPLFVVLKV